MRHLLEAEECPKRGPTGRFSWRLPQALAELAAAEEAFMAGQERCREQEALCKGVEMRLEGARRPSGLTGTTTSPVSKVSPPEESEEHIAAITAKHFEVRHSPD